MVEYVFESDERYGMIRGVTWGYKRNIMGIWKGINGCNGIL